MPKPVPLVLILVTPNVYLAELEPLHVQLPILINLVASDSIKLTSLPLVLDVVNVDLDPQHVLPELWLPAVITDSN